MKGLVLLGLALMIGSTAFAQQPTEWRPNIAEDNKAVSWEDTAAFLDQWALTTAHRHDWSITGSTTDTRCKVHLAVKWGNGDIHNVVADMNLAKIDPLTITVQSTTEANAGAGNDSFLIGKEAIWQPKNDRGVTKSNGVVCPSDLKQVRDIDSCTVQPVNAYKFTFFFDSQEDARRYGRALMHAVLLCGGAKSVSPF